MEFKIKGRIVETESELGVRDLLVRAWDKDRCYDDLLGNATTDAEGRFEIVYSSKAFRELFEARPDIYLSILTPDRKRLHDTRDAIRWQASAEESFDLQIDRKKLGIWAPTKPEGAPQIEKGLADRARVKASSQPPAGAEIELGRLWFPEGKEVKPTIKRVEGKPSFSVRAPFSLVDVKRPELVYDALKREQLAKLDLQTHSKGFRPTHLDLTFRPNLTDRLRPRVGLGEDLPLNIFDTPADDDRYIYRDTSFPWCTVGRVETALGSCTGTMIGRRLMLTGSHCMDWTNGGATWVKFTPAYYNGDAPFGVAWGERVIYWNQAAGGLSDFETAFDYVVIVLDEPLGELTGYPGARAYATSWNGGNYWQNMGYAGDLSGGERPAFSGGGAIASVSSHTTSGQTGYVMGNFIDITRGHSGGPCWGWWEGEGWPRVVGTASAEARVPSKDTSGDNEFGGGPALISLISYARSTYP